MAKSKIFPTKTTTFRIGIPALNVIRVAAEKKGQSIRVFIERAALRAAQRPVKLTGNSSTETM